MEIDQQHKVLIEELEIHILALSTSSIDQAALFSDCLQWIQQTDTHLTTTSNITITDNKLVFFSADKLAAQFERGTQTGGHYPCGSRGVRKQRTDDYVSIVHSTARCSSPFSCQVIPVYVTTLDEILLS